MLVETMKKLQKRIIELEDQVFILQDALGINIMFDPELKLSRTAQQILGIIYKRPIATYNMLLCTLPAEGSRLSINVHIHNLRKKLSLLGIEIKCMHGQGYYVSNKDKEELKKFVVVTSNLIYNKTSNEF